MSALSIALAVAMPGAAEALSPGQHPDRGRAATREREPCTRAGSSTLLETGKVRVYAMPKESTSRPEHRNPTITDRPVFGCLKTTGDRLLLDLPEVANEQRALWVEVDSGTVAANGPLVAYTYTEYYLDTHGTWVRVRDLRTGAVIRTCLVGGAIAPSRLPRVTDIVLSSSGEVGWNAEGEGPGRSEDHVPGCNPTA